ncbi:MAG: FKBP-type peptidyl-prolyl cis-trans isomerase [Planctomycetota bacterium]|nr:FKBP-type peptidyl-prolyl cis-trans isomerase [Planctomycetota bacterium]
MLTRWTDFAVVAIACCQITMAQEEQVPAPTDAKSLNEKASYIIGFDIGNNIKSQDLGLNVDLLIKGISAAMSGEELGMTDAEVAEVMQAFQQQALAMAQKKSEEQATANQAEGAAFLKANKAKEGVVTTESGLQYKVIKAGEGPSPAAEDTIKANYKGTFINGEVFDQSQEGQPIEIPVGAVIKGWVEALQLMKVGSKWELYVPGDLAYGPQGPPGIGPNRTLIFEVELLEIVSKDAPGDK